MTSKILDKQLPGVAAEGAVKPLASSEWNISVIVPVYNGANFISQAIDSILAQSCAPTEIIMIDDCSTDDTALIVQRYGSAVRYHRQLNSGTSVARNTGVRLSQGNLLAFLDADDLWAEDKLEKQLAVLQNNPQVDLVWGNVIEFTGDVFNPEASTQPTPGHHPGTMLIRRQAFEVIGEFSEDYQQGEVVEWMTRVLLSEVEQLMLRDVLMYRRIHGANKGIANPQADREYLHILKKHLDRRRAD